MSVSNDENVTVTVKNHLEMENLKVVLHPFFTYVLLLVVLLLVVLLQQLLLGITSR